MSLLLVVFVVLVVVCIGSLAGYLVEMIPGPNMDIEFAMSMLKVSLLSGTISFGLVWFI